MGFKISLINLPFTDTCSTKAMQHFNFGFIIFSVKEAQVSVTFSSFSLVAGIGVIVAQLMLQNEYFICKEKEKNMVYRQ